MELLLPLLEGDIKASYQELTSWVNSEREKRGIDVPEAPKAVKNDYAMHLAINKKLSSNELTLLSELKY